MVIGRAGFKLEGWKIKGTPVISLWGRAMNNMNKALEQKIRKALCGRNQGDTKVPLTNLDMLVSLFRNALINQNTFSFSEE